MTQSRVGVSVVTSLMDGPPDSSALEPSLVRVPPPRRLLATPLFCSREGDASPFSSGPSSISDDNDPLDELLAAGRSDEGIGRL